MKYLLAFVRDQDRMYEGTEEDMKAAMDAWNEFDREAIEAGVLIANEALELPKTGKTVRFGEAGERAVTDGPFAETKEQLGGFYVFECGDLDEALELAARIPGARHGAVEVRPVWELPADMAATPAGASASRAD